MKRWLWYLDDGSVEPFPEDQINGYYGFTYIITNLETNKFYIGKKAFIHNKKKKLTKKEIAEQTGPGRKATTRVDQVDSGWKSYWGSSKELLADVKKLGEDKFERLILKFAKTKKQLTYYELESQILHNALFDSTSYNDNILGKFFKKDFVTTE
jgi:hypothetical protein